MDSIHADLLKEIEEFPEHIREISLEILEAINEGKSEQNIMEKVKRAVDRAVAEQGDRE